jgi:TPR repeat protein
MSAYQVAVVEDEAHPATGAAVIRIEGLKQWPPGATVRLVPIDETAVPAQSEGWPWGDIVPLRVVPTPNGVDVVLDAEVANSARLLPGTPLSIRVEAARIEADARWPDITPPFRRRSSAVAMSAAQLVAAKADRERTEAEAAARRQEMASMATYTVRQAAAEAAQNRAAQNRSAKRGSTASKSQEGGQLARLVPFRKADAAFAASADAGPAELSQLARLTIAADDGGAITPSQAAAPRRAATITGRLTAFIAGMVTTAALVAGIVWFAPTYLRTVTAQSAVPAPPIVEQVSAASLDGVFKDLTATGTVSPRRKSAANVDLATALSLADHSLRGQRSSGETDEAEFWLRRALVTSIGGSEVSWALTQLGTIYAQADNPRHSYAKAHALWQLASAQGDAVAHCFLGALYEHGLGVPPDRKIARSHYLAAEAADACRNAKDAVARLKD